MISSFGSLIFLYCSFMLNVYDNLIYKENLERESSRCERNLNWTIKQNLVFRSVKNIGIEFMIYQPRLKNWCCEKTGVYKNFLCSCFAGDDRNFQDKIWQFLPMIFISKVCFLFWKFDVLCPGYNFSNHFIILYGIFYQHSWFF